jgi:glutaminyl-peptide cyclotransferase
MRRRLLRFPAPGAALAAAMLAVVVCATPGIPRADGFDGARALEHARQLVAIGPRVAGTRGAEKARGYITTQLKAIGLTVEPQSFQARTPHGMTPMVNLRAIISGTSAERATSPRLIVCGHYDTKRFQEFSFVGANDGGSSAALLIELARTLKARPSSVDVELLFLDGEEAVIDWSLQNDHTYGSRHYVDAERRAGRLERIGAVILVDMIGDRDLRILRESNSTGWLTDIVWGAARKLGKTAFVDEATPIEDDHLEFLEAGVPAVDIIDLDYAAWHKAGDTMDKLSAESLQAVGDVLVAAIPDVVAKIAK